MIFPAVTAFYAALFGLVLFALTIWVIATRFRQNVLIGDGGNDVMTRSMRAHANFTEYMPLILILASLFETTGGSRPILRIVLTVLLVARVAHPFGMMAQENSIRQFACRWPAGNPHIFEFGRSLRAFAATPGVGKRFTRLSPRVARRAGFSPPSRRVHRAKSSVLESA